MKKKRKLQKYPRVFEGAISGLLKVVGINYVYFIKSAREKRGSCNNNFESYIQKRMESGIGSIYGTVYKRIEYITYIE